MKERVFDTLKAHRTPQSQPPNLRLCQCSDRQRALSVDQHQVSEAWGDDCREWVRRERKPKSPFYPGPEEV